jgi:gamma-tubulin complex component 4
VKLQDYVKLDNGSAHLGFTHETENLENLLVLENWTFISEARSGVHQQQDPWNGLSLDYRSHWPLHLIFSSDVIEKYNILFRFLLPIKRVQLDLQHIWTSKVRSNKAFSGDPNFRKPMLLR